MCVCAVKKKAGGGKKGASGGSGAETDRPVDISRLDLRVGVVISADKVTHLSMNNYRKKC